MLDLPNMKEVAKAFPHPEMRPKQESVLKAIVANAFRFLFELPTGEGKTAILLVVLLAVAKKIFKLDWEQDNLGPCFYVTPTKTQVVQIATTYPEQTMVIYGRSEYKCLYYADRGQKVNAEDSPCYLLDCPHRVGQESGEITHQGAEACPYLLQKYLVKTHSQGKAVVCTTAFFLVNRAYVPSWRDLNPGLVCVDEIHNIAKVARRIFQYTLTDYHLFRLVDMVKPIDPANAQLLLDFANYFKHLCWKKQTYAPTLLESQDIENLIAMLGKINQKPLEANIKKAIKSGQIDPEKQRGELKTLENLIFRIRSMIRSLQYSLEKNGHQPLNYVVAFYYKKDDPEFTDSQKKARFFLTIYSYYVAPIIKKTLGERLVACSATIGDPDILSFETGLKLPFQAFDSSFDVSNCRIFMPNDTPNLAKNKRQRNDLNKALRRIVKAAKQFADQGLRSLIVVIANSERDKIMEFATEAGLNAISYGNGVHPKESAEKFKSGQGDALVGTAANYGEGVDLPKNTAPIIFFLRPGYARPDDPEAQFEDRRFSDGHVWALRKWRVMIEALQVRGRNIRNASDLGVCFFISQGFKSFLFHSLPQWLQPAYRKDLTMDDAVKETLELLSE